MTLKTNAQIRQKLMPIDYYNIASLKTLRESEDKVEFKAATSNFNWNGGKHTDQKERRKCYLGYIVALCNGIRPMNYMFDC